MGTGRFGSQGDGRRSEDGRLLTGRGRFTDDVRLPGQAYAAFVRSPAGHADLRAVDATAAVHRPGVLAVYTAADLGADGLGPIPPAVSLRGRAGVPMLGAPIPVLAAGRVRHVGEPVAVVVADTLAQAVDAAEAVRLDLAPLPAAADVAAAIAPGAPAIWPDAPGNVCLDWEDGDRAAVDAAFAGAACVVRVRLADPPVAPAALEPRTALGAWDAVTGRYTLVAGTQGVALVRKLLAESVFRVAPDRIRVLTHDVGGGFGMKVQVYPEYAAVLYAARRLGRPVKWCAGRIESFGSDTRGRDGVLEGELALGADGRFLALRARSLVGIGAYVSTYAAIIATNNTKNCLSSVYAIPAIHFTATMAFTNAAPLGPYRGAGRPEALYVVERLVDAAARELRIDRVELRRRNLIPAAAMPYRAPNGPVYDGGDFEAVLDKALALADWAGFPERRARSERAGALRGIGVCCFLEVAGGSPLQETADLRFEADGTVTLRTGAQALGQGHLTTFPRVVAARLGIPVSAVRVVQGDSDEVPAGLPTVASRSTMMAGSAAVRACEAAIENGRRLAAHLLEAAVPDVAFDAGRFRVVGTDRSIALPDLAERGRAREGLPPELAGGLDAMASFESPQMSFPNGCHVCEVEIDPHTGAVAVVGYAAVDDVGRILHEPIVEGQIHGGVAQGLGQVLGERLVYGEDGQLLTASLLDYPLPRAADLPPLRLGHHVVPCATNPLGAKGAGESGVAGALPAAMSAVLDALAARGVDHVDLPVTSFQVWAALQNAQRRRPRR